MKELLQLIRQHGLTLAVAESCTGGLIGQEITRIPGSSDVFWGGVLSYANDAKVQLLHVSQQTIMTHGAVSEQTLNEMLNGLETISPADLGIAVTGIAGPGGGSSEKPVGTVWIGLSHRNKYRACKEVIFAGNRDSVRSQTADFAFKQLKEYLQTLGT